MVQMSTYEVAVLVGSLRRESLNCKLANELIALAPASLKMAIVEIAALPHYSEDEDANPPMTWQHFRDRIRKQMPFFSLRRSTIDQFPAFSRTR